MYLFINLWNILNCKCVFFAKCTLHVITDKSYHRIRHLYVFLTTYDTHYWMGIDQINSKQEMSSMEYLWCSVHRHKCLTQRIDRWNWCLNCLRRATVTCNIGGASSIVCHLSRQSMRTAAWGRHTLNWFKKRTCEHKNAAFVMWD